MYQVQNSNVYLMDTPGFDDTYKPDAAILDDIAEALVAAFVDRAEIQGALYIHQVTDARMRGSGRKNLIMFQNVLGEKTMDHCRLVTTKWSLQPESVSMDRERELCEKKEFWQPLLAAGAQTVRFGDSRESAMDIITPLLQKPPIEPLLVEEIVEGHKLTEDTHAGMVVNDDLEKAKKMHLAEIADLIERGKKASGEMKRLMSEERREHEAKLAEVQKQKDILGKRVSARSGRVGRWVARGCAWVGGGVLTAASGGILAPLAGAIIAGTEAGAQVHKHSR